MYVCIIPYPAILLSYLYFSHTTGDQLKVAELEEAHDADYIVIEQLDEQISVLTRELDAASSQRDKAVTEGAFVSDQLERLVKEKRTGN
jgi:hypothetical protein